MKIQRKFSRRYTILFYGMIGLLFIIAAYITAGFAEEPEEPAYTDNYNGLSIAISNAHLTTDADTAKVIALIDVELTNDSDHGFTFHTDHLTYNDSESVSTLFDVDESELSDVIARGDTVAGTITITLDTRDIDSVTTFEPTFSIYDMKTEQDKEINPILHVK